MNQKTPAKRNTPFVLLALAGVLMWSVSDASAQAPAQLDIYLLPGMVVKSAGSSIQTIQYTSTPAISNSWQDLTNVLVSTSGVWVVDFTATNAQKRFYRALSQSPPITVPTNMVYIPPGSFYMGRPLSERGGSQPGSPDEEPQHLVTLTKGFWMGKYEVTQDEYMAVTQTNPSTFRGGKRPVEEVSLQNSTDYCVLLTFRERQAGRLPVNWEYRLPTEAEWEYACRAGTTTATHYGDYFISGMADFNGTNEYLSTVGTVINTNGTYLGTTTNVGSYAPNAWGLYDMHGNVAERCLYVGGYSSNSIVDPSPVAGAAGLIRGGGYATTGFRCRSAARANTTAAAGNPDRGFRVVLAEVRQ